MNVILLTLIPFSDQARARDGDEASEGEAAGVDQERPRRVRGDPRGMVNLSNKVSPRLRGLERQRS